MYLRVRQMWIFNNNFFLGGGCTAELEALASSARFWERVSKK